jgi:SAM-dependent methyltransferase
MMTGSSKIAHSSDYVEYCRQTARHVRTLHDLALRGKNKEEITQQIHDRIVEVVGLRSGDDLVDIGCGDGTLLKMAERIRTRSAIGLLATDEEVAVLRRSGFNVRQGFTDKLPISDESASVVVCNSVLLVVPREKIPVSLREIYRIARRDARIFVGEIPFVPGNPPGPKFETRRELLSYLYSTYGLRTWFGMLRRMAYWTLMGKPPVILDGTRISFYAPPEEFIGMADAVGLQLVRYWQHEHPNTRNNYLFRKVN